MDSNESRARALLGDLSAGCSAVAWETADGGHLWGRNLISTALRRTAR